MSGHTRSSTAVPVIWGIQGSPHAQGMTARLVHSALDGAKEEGAETRFLQLSEEKLSPCAACGGNCFSTKECVRDDEATRRSARLWDADGIVFGVPVYCWQINGLSSMFIDKMRWNTGSVLEHRNARPAIGIASAGGSGTGCVLALQTLYKYFYNWAFHGLSPIPVSRFNFENALNEAREAGRLLVRVICEGVSPFPSLGAAMAHYETLPYMKHTPLDELALIVRWIGEGLGQAAAGEFAAERSEAEKALAVGDRERAAAHLSKAYEAGSRLWSKARRA